MSSIVLIRLLRIIVTHIVIHIVTHIATHIVTHVVAHIVGSHGIQIHVICSNSSVT